MNIEAIVKNGEVKLVIANGMQTHKLDGRGHCRQVFTLNNQFYIKFDNPVRWGNDDEGKQTSLELEVAKCISEADKKYFCLPVASGEIDGLKYTVQEAAVHDDEAFMREGDVDELERILAKYGLAGDVGYGIFGLHNCAYTKDGWKIYDYAFVD